MAEINFNIPTKLLYFINEKARYKISHGGRGASKCLGKGTEVMMADASIKKVEDIIAGDLVMGFDLKPLKVHATTYGYDYLFLIKQSQGIDYIVTGDHLLSLIDTFGNVINVSVNELLSGKEFRRYLGYKGNIHGELSSIEVESIGDGEYFGFETEGHGLFCLADGTVTHNSWSIAACLVVRAFQGKEKILCTRAYQNSILDSVHSLLTGAIARLGLVEYFTITKTSIRTNFRGSPELESEFIFKGLQNNIDEIKSMEGITICWVEEAHSIDASGWNILIPTIRFENSEIWISFNARYATDATYQMFVQRFEDIKEYDPSVEYNENSLVRIENKIYISLQPCNKGIDLEAATFKERWKLYAIFQKVNYYDNPFFSKTELAAEMELCKQMNYDEYLHIWEGNPKTESNAIVFKDRYKIEPFEQHPIEMMLKKRIFAGMDFGWNDPTTYVECYIVDTTLYIIREAYRTQVLLDDLVGFLQESVPDILQRKPLIYGDSSRPDIIKKLANEGLRIKSVKKTTVSQDPLEKQKSEGYVKSGVDFIRRFNIVIHPRCVKTIEEFQNYKYEVKEDESGTEIVLDKFVDKWNHCIDAIRYALAELISKPRSTMADIAHSIMARKANK